MDSIEKMYKKYDKLKKEDLELLKNWLRNQPHLPILTDYEVIWFLHSCYFSNEAAKRTIDNYFTMRTLAPEIFKNDDNKAEIALRDTLDVVLFTELSEKTSHGYRAYLAHLTDPDASKYNFNCAIKLWDSVITLDIDENGPEEGVIFIFNVARFGLGHLARVGPSSMKKFLIYIQEGMPVRLKGLYFFNVTPIMDKLMLMMKPFLKKEVANSIRLFSNYKDMEAFIPVKSFPSDLGGVAETTEVLHERMKQKLKDNKDRLEAHSLRLVDESKRPGKPKGEIEIFGIDGTFKTIEVD